MFVSFLVVQVFLLHNILLASVRARLATAVDDMRSLRQLRPTHSCAWRGGIMGEAGSFSWVDLNAEHQEGGDQCCHRALCFRHEPSVL